MRKLLSLLLTTTCLTLIPKLAYSLTWSFSGYTIEDNGNRYIASGSFILPDGFSGSFDINTANIPTTLNINVTTISGTNADFSFNSGNINFGSSSFDGTVIGNIATFTSINILENFDPVTNNFKSLFDTGGIQAYDNPNAGVSLDTSVPDTASGSSFGDATGTPTPLIVPFEFNENLAVSVAVGIIAFGYWKRNQK